MKSILKNLWFGTGTAAGITLISFSSASVPTKAPAAGTVTDDTALYENLSEIRSAREKDLNFDGDIEHLSKLEGHYREKLPSRARAAHARLQGPMQRISAKQYRPSQVKPAASVTAQGPKKSVARE